MGLKLRFTVKWRSTKGGLWPKGRPLWSLWLRGCLEWCLTLQGGRWWLTLATIAVNGDDGDFETMKKKEENSPLLSLLWCNIQFTYLFLFELLGIGPNKGCQKKKGSNSPQILRIWAQKTEFYIIDPPSFPYWQNFPLLTKPWHLGYLTCHLESFFENKIQNPPICKSLFI